MRILATGLLLIGVMIGGCEQSEEDSQNNTGTVSSTTPAREQNQQPDKRLKSVVLVEFQEASPGIDPYRVRMLFTDEYLRIDDVEQSDGYVLFDRRKRRIYSVSHDNRQVLLVAPVSEMSPAPDDLTIQAELVTLDKDMPMVNDTRPVHHRYKANGTTCYDVISVAGFMPEIHQALIAYQKVLALQQYETLETTPEALRTPCFLANYIYGPVNYISKGFPIEQWDMSGYRRSLYNIDPDVRADIKLFQLPENYEFFTLSGKANKVL